MRYDEGPHAPSSVMRYLTLLLLVICPASAAAQPSSLIVTPDTLVADDGSPDENRFLLVNSRRDRAVSFDSMGVGVCTPFCTSDFSPFYLFAFEYEGSLYEVFTNGVETLTGPFPDVMIAPGDSLKVYYIYADSCPVCGGGRHTPDAFLPVQFWGDGEGQPVERTLFFLFPVDAEPWCSSSVM